MSSRRRAQDYARRLGQVAGKARSDTGIEPARSDTGLEPAPPAPEEPAPMLPPVVVDQPPAPRRRRRRRAGPQVRVTVDLDRDTHRALRQLALDTDADASEILRLLIGRALRDPRSAEAIRAELDEPT